MRQIDEVLMQFDPITLEEMSVVKLMNRIDTKYVIALPVLLDLLREAAPEYCVQCNDGKRTAEYHTIYLDTRDKRMYNAHATGRKVREKIRVRTYMDTDDTFLEVKNKNNHGRTKKKRITVPSCREIFTDPKVRDDADDFLRAKAWYLTNELQPHVENRFNRITLVNKGKTERLTIDLGVRFHNFDNEADADIAHLVIVELKRDGLTHSPMRDILLRRHIQPGGFSKYCIGCALTNPNLRHNLFNEKLLRIRKLKG
ncbi:MAG: polyphosphate polymerase domain-containing protein [Bacteroidales bacterium]|nr:polyphosphate polymerase domain-containing protein [Candidatus Liminaster caballi]